MYNFCDNRLQLLFYLADKFAATPKSISLFHILTLDFRLWRRGLWTASGRLHNDHNQDDGEHAKNNSAWKRKDWLQN